MRVVHGDLIDEQNEALTMHGAFIGACVMGNIDKAIEQNATYQHLLAGMGAKVDAKQAHHPGRAQLPGWNLEGREGTERLHQVPGLRPRLRGLPPGQVMVARGIRRGGPRPGRG